MMMMMMYNVFCVSVDIMLGLLIVVRWLGLSILLYNYNASLVKLQSSIKS